jgi:hypothetical protein
MWLSRSKLVHYQLPIDSTQHFLLHVVIVLAIYARQGAKTDQLRNRAL